MRRRLGIAVALVLALSACGGNADTENDTSDPVRVVVIGGLPTAEPELSEPCPGCDPFWAQFADHVGSEVGTETAFDAVSVGSVQEALKTLSGPGVDADKVAAADVVLVSTGANQALPDPGTGIGCKEWFLDAQGPCLAEGVKTYGKIYDELYASIKALRGDEPTVYVQATSTNNNISPPTDVPDGLLSLYTKEGREAEAKAWAVAAYDRWSAMQTERATAAGFQVVDTYHAANGPDGTRDLVPELNEDGILNAAGHDLFASLLAGVDLSAISDR
jgi:hypothetical protein